ncbi:tripartite motif-containing protein 45-like isoform X2 [Pomacea canaliculata]|uniref:tripartite motif-containing protein 45-like isoform X2 n=1 Tax=Pomacea canaliculata TaxID=400727 RepID=UPI000D72864B|nr:tripartite motif-containing protein 45-like isoform X2 [Pomacea canaliculata]
MAPTHKRECALCTEEFATPKILPCGHLLCRQCIISWMDSKPDAGCPLCRCPIVEQSDGSSSATVDALPTDFVMEALVESARVLSKDHLCCVCEDVRADFICLQCQDMMCPACTKAHKKFSGTRSHDVESVSTVTPERLAASRPALCADHGDKHAEYYCFKHRLAVCSACKANKHNVCPEVNYLDNEIDSAQNLLNDLTKILVEAEQKLEQAIGQVTSRLQEVDVSEQEDLAQVDKTCDRLYKMVEDFRNNLKEKTRTSHLKIRNSLRDVKTDLSNRLGKMTSHKHIVTRATSVSPRPALIHMTLTLALTYRINSLDLSTYLQRELWEKPLSSVECCKKLVRRIQQELLMLEQQWTVAELDPQPPILVFHDNCGTNIRLTNGNITAEKIDSQAYCNVVVVSRDAMVANVLYEVKVDEVTATENTLCVGVTRTPPACLDITRFSEDLEDSSIIGVNGISHQERFVSFHGYKCKQMTLWFRIHVFSTIGDSLRRLQGGSRVGVLVDSFNDFHLYLDGQDQGIVATDIPPPWFAVFDICGSITKVTGLPIS